LIFYLDTSNNVLHARGYIGTTTPPLTNPQSITFPHSGINSSSQISSIHGSHNGPLSFLTTNGSFFSFTSTSGTLSLERLGDTDSPKLSAITSTKATKTSITFFQPPASNLIHILTFSTHNAFLSFYTNPSSSEAGSYEYAMAPGRVKSLTAGATSFALLTEEGEIYTWGDPRYSRCLARLPTSSTPASTPSLVDALGGIPISKIDAAGWVFGALSKEQDLYLWGVGRPGSDGDDGLRDLLGNGDEEVKLVEIEAVESVIDFGIGDGFIVVLAEGGDVWVRGDNGNGQLGIGREEKLIREWTKVERARIGVGNVVEVVVGDLCTFLLTSRRGS
jgi:hypothetical protein